MMKRFRDFQMQYKSERKGLQEGNLIQISTNQNLTGRFTCQSPTSGIVSRQQKRLELNPFTETKHMNLP